MKKLVLLCFMFMTVNSWYWGWPFSKKPNPLSKSGVTDEAFERQKLTIGREIEEREVKPDEFKEMMNKVKNKDHFNIDRNWYIE